MNGKNMGNKTYKIDKISKLPLKYLIEEGFVEIKIVKITHNTANLVIDTRMVPNLPIKKQEMLLLSQDAEFLHKYNKNKNEFDEGDSSFSLF